MFATDFKSAPCWWDATPRPDLPLENLPRQVDVAIVGSGYTGLHAALVTARAGRSTLVLDAEDAGFGCSTRNGGQIGDRVKPSLGTLTRRYGAETARGILAEDQAAIRWLGAFIGEEGIDCTYQVCGRFHAAHKASAYGQLESEMRSQPKGLAVPYRLVSRDAQREELGTDAYYGGVVYEDHASLDPGRYHQGLLQRALAVGVQVAPHCAVTGLEKSTNGFDLKTKRGPVQARDVVIATNGYTGALTPWLRRRVIPIGSYIIATEPLEPALMDRLMPKDRVVSDTRRVVYYYRPSPDRRRILFGGRVSASETDTLQSARRLKRDLVRLFPELESAQISHSWMGFVAYTFDTVASCGQRDGLFYAMGYCGSGIAMASYLGHKVGQQVLWRPEGETAFLKPPLTTRPLYVGKPWFLPASVAAMRLLDRM